MNQAGAQCAKKDLRSRFGGETIDQAAGADHSRAGPKFIVLPGRWFSTKLSSEPFASADYAAACPLGK